MQVPLYPTDFSCFSAFHRVFGVDFLTWTFSESSTGHSFFSGPAGFRAWNLTKDDVPQFVASPLEAQDSSCVVVGCLEVPRRLAGFRIKSHSSILDMMYL